MAAILMTCFQAEPGPPEQHSMVRAGSKLPDLQLPCLLLRRKKVLLPSAPLHSLLAREIGRTPIESRIARRK